MMNLAVVNRFFHFPRNSIIPTRYTVQTREYAGPGKEMKSCRIVDAYFIDLSIIRIHV